MAGILPFQAKRGALSLGYREATAGTASLALRPGETFCGHEFHRWQLETSQPFPQELWKLKGWGVPERHEGWGSAELHASWLHLHWGGCPSIPRRLAATAKRWAHASDPCKAL
jgi:cobyrinic acid a,c-diamide synthase